MHSILEEAKSKGYKANDLGCFCEAIMTKEFLNLVGPNYSQYFLPSHKKSHKSKKESE